jgi:tetratricopeptide (TPR) repeat protein
MDLCGRVRTSTDWTSRSRLILGDVAHLRCRYEEMAEAAEQALRHRRLAGQEVRDSDSLARALVSGPRPADEALRVLDATLPETPSVLSTLAPWLGRSLCALGRYDEAEPLAELGCELGHEQDAATQMVWRQVMAAVEANRGEHARAEQLEREAVAISERTDALNWQGNALCDLAEVLHAAGRTQEAAATLEQALERYEHKRNLAMAEQARARLAELRSVATPAASV